MARWRTRPLTPEPPQNPMRPLLWLLLNLALVAGAGLAGALGLLWQGAWQPVLMGLGAGVLCPPVFIALHWLRLAIDLPAMLAADAGMRWFSMPLRYISGLYTAFLVLGWVALVFAGVAENTPAWASLAWGYALTSAPLLLIVLRPAGFPLLMLLVFVAQLAYPAAWAIRQLAGLPATAAFAFLAAVVIVVPLASFSRRWQMATRPD